MSDLWSILPGVGVIVWCYFNLSLMLYLDLKKLDILEGYLEGSKWVSDSQALFDEGLIERNLRLGVV